MQNKIQGYIDRIMKEAKSSSDINISCLLCEPSTYQEDKVEISLLFINGYESDEYKKKLRQMTVNIEQESVKIQASLTPPMRIQFLVEVCEEINGLIDHSVTEHPVDVGMFSESSAGSCDYIEPLNFTKGQKTLFTILKEELAHAYAEVRYRIFSRLQTRMDMHSVMVLQMGKGIRATGGIPIRRNGRDEKTPPSLIWGRGSGGMGKERYFFVTRGIRSII